MRKAAVLLMTMALALVMASGIALAASELDQQQTLTDGGFAVVDDETNAPLGQTFTAGKSGTLDKVALYVGCCADASGNIRGTPPDVELSVAVRTVDSSGLPSNTWAGLASVPASNFSGDGSLNRVEVPLEHYCVLGNCNGFVSAGQQYVITIEEEGYFCLADTSIPCDPPTTGGYQWGHTTPSAYPGGNALTNSGGAWQVQDQYDFAFETFVTPGPTAGQDTTAPDTSITSGPSDPTNDTTPTFSFSGSDNVSQAANLLYSYEVDSGEWSAYSPETSVTLGGASGLSEGLYTFYVKAKDEAGNEDANPAQQSFTIDTTAPKVDGVVPAENATKIGPAVNVKASFSEAMQATSINTDTVQLLRAGTTTPISAVVSYDEGMKMVTLNPDANLQRGTEYKAVVSTGTRDLAANQLDQDATLSDNQPKEWFFTIRK